PCSPDSQGDAPRAATRPARRDSRQPSVLWRWVSAVALLAVGAVAGGAWVHTALERPALEAARERIDRYEQDIAAMRGRLDESLNALAALEGRFLVEESTR